MLSKKWVKKVEQYLKKRKTLDYTIRNIKDKKIAEEATQPNTPESQLKITTTRVLKLNIPIKEKISVLEDCKEREKKFDTRNNKGGYEKWKKRKKRKNMCCLPGHNALAIQTTEQVKNKTIM